MSSFSNRDFVFADFNETAGLVINGDAGTTVCHFDMSVSGINY
jgi:hypothetical protein